MSNNVLEKTRTCAKCKKTLGKSSFPKVHNKLFHPGGHSIYCIDCLETMAPAKDLAKVDKLLQWMDIPLLVDKWTNLYRNAGDHTLRVYLKMLEDNEETYSNIDWATMNRKWEEEEAAGRLDEHLDGAQELFLLKMSRKWPSETERTIEDYYYLENLYNDLLSTQNLITATQRDDAKRLCEIGLIINKKIRSGLPAKDEMAMYHNIIKAEGFEPKNSKNIGEFESVGEIFSWLAKRGWRPKWHQEPKDSVDFSMKQMQNFLSRLIQNESGIPDKVESRRKQLEVMRELGEDNIAFDEKDMNEQEILETIDYEDENEFLKDFQDDDNSNEE